jgi:hypothetical protein
MRERRPVADGGGGTRCHCCDAGVPPVGAPVRLLDSDSASGQASRL